MSINIFQMEIKYDRIGANYNYTRKADKYLTDRIVKLLNPKSGKKYLDIGCGTGNYTFELHKRGVDITGVDPSETMLNKAKQKCREIPWRIGTAENAGLESQSVDGIVATLTIHHWTDLNAGFSEMSRVLKAGGRIIIFTSTPEQMQGYWLNHYFPQMLRDSMLQMPVLSRVEEAMESAGISVDSTEKYYIRPDLEDLFLYCGKHNPQLYFDPAVRQGISSFSALANVREVEEGLDKLKVDIDSGKIAEIIDNYKNNIGDYLFIVGKKM